MYKVKTNSTSQKILPDNGYCQKNFYKVFFFRGNYKKNGYKMKDKTDERKSTSCQYIKYSTCKNMSCNRQKTLHNNVYFKVSNFTKHCLFRTNLQREWIFPCTNRNKNLNGNNFFPGIFVQIRSYIYFYSL